jgi:hypothetical protein
MVTIIFMCMVLAIKYDMHAPSRGELGILVWAVCGGLFVAYVILGFILGKKGADDLTSSVLEKLVRIFQRVSGNA